MSYDIELKDPITRKTIVLDSPHMMRGGTYCLGGKNLAELNITYNYGKFYCQIFGDNGIRFLYGKTAAETIPHLKEGAALLGNDVTDNYWDATEGNAKRALEQLLALAEMRPDGIWSGD